MESNSSTRIDVLFVCVHNAGRSQMAEYLFNDQAVRKGLPFRAVSAGTMGGKTVNPMAAAAMEELGVPMNGAQPKLLTQDMVDASGRIITMGCGVDADACPARFLVTEDWGLDDPAGQPIETVRAIRDQIRTLVDKLLEEMNHA